MKKISAFLLAGLTSLAFPVHAATGSANDGLYLVLFVVAILLIIAAIGSMINFLRHPPQAFLSIPKRLVKTIRSWFARILRFSVTRSGFWMLRYPSDLHFTWTHCKQESGGPGIN